MSMILIEFECQGYQFALPLDSLRRVLPCAQPTPLPGAPEIVLGVLNFAGEVAVIVNFYRRVGLPFSAIGISQQLLLVDIAGACIGLVVDRVSGIVTREIEDRLPMPRQFAGADFVQSILQLDDGLCIICDLEKFLLEDEKILIGHALEQIRHVEH
jgi:chemotaxis signal transduction protein